MLKNDENHIPTPNFWPDRKGHIPLAIVVHVTEGSFESAKDWTTRPESSASYHYIVREDGKIFQFVEEHEAAWSNGLVVDSKWPGIIPRVNPNLYTLSVAYSGTAARGPTLQQFLAMSSLIAQLSVTWEIPLDDLHVIPHNQIRTDKSCPGPHCEVSALRYFAGLSAAN